MEREMSENRTFVFSEPLPDLSLGNLTLNLGSYSVCVNDQPVDLSVHEFEVLSILVHQPDRILPYAQLAEEVWKSSDRKHIRHLNVLIHRLRQKLTDSRPFAIHTVRGRGYGLVRVRTPAGPAPVSKDDSNLEARLMTI
jgi:DNA-binding response OmpR family regulator